MRTDITPGQTSNYLGFDLVMDDNLPEPKDLLADRGYDADRIRKSMHERDILTQIPMRKTRKMRVGVDHGCTGFATWSSVVSTSSKTPAASPPDTTKPQKATSDSSA